MKKLTIKMLLVLHKAIAEKSRLLPGIKDINLLQSALDSPFQTFGSTELYPSDIDKISVVVFSLIKNHCMNDGNKRLGISALILLCNSSRLNIKSNTTDLENLALSLAEGKTSREKLVTWIKKNIKKK